MKKFTIVILSFVFTLSGILGAIMPDAQATVLASKLKGRILLQVQDNGEAWYVNPENENRYYMGRPADAFELMRELGLGITNNDLYKIKIGQLSGQTLPLGAGPSNHWTDYNLSRKLSGKILIQVQEHGEAWYVNPIDLKRYYLGRPADAFNIMRSFGLGITNSDLNLIKIAYNSPKLIESVDKLEIKNFDFAGIDLYSDFQKEYDKIIDEVFVQQVLIGGIEYYKFYTEVSNLNYFYPVDFFVDEEEQQFVRLLINVIDYVIVETLPELDLSKDERIDFYFEDKNNKSAVLDFPQYGSSLFFSEENSQDFMLLTQRLEDDYGFGNEEHLEMVKQMIQVIVLGEKVNQEELKNITDDIYGADTLLAYEGLSLNF